MDKTNFSIRKMFTYSCKPKILIFIGIVLICIMNLWIYRNKGAANFHEGNVHCRTLSDNNAKKEDGSRNRKVKNKEQRSTCNNSNITSEAYNDYSKIYNYGNSDNELSASDLELFKEENFGLLEDMTDSINKEIKELEEFPSKDILRNIWFKVHCNERNKFLSLKYSIRKIHDKYFCDTNKNEELGKKVWNKCCAIIMEEFLKLDSIQNSLFHNLMEKETVTLEEFEDFVKLCMNGYKYTKKQTKKKCVKKLNKTLSQRL
ncbi:Plasmodium exported protein (PHISTc), unknown function [Plasmodium sp. DRC-Itaito]|nr:Plasmodium exported protein (PHISTc), unknown function [Plasmodium sp. DRC-Itaito]